MRIACIAQPMPTAANGGPNSIRLCTRDGMLATMLKYATIIAQKPTNKDTRTAASEAAPNVDMLVKELNETQQQLRQMHAAPPAPTAPPEQ